VAAQHPFKLSLNKTALGTGDTLSFDFEVLPWIKSKGNGTLNLWIEDVYRTQVWRLRYPVMAGTASGNLVFPANLSHSFFNLHFSLQDNFFQLRGRLRNPAFRGDSLDCVFTNADGIIYRAKGMPDSAGNFRTAKVWFEQQVQVQFFSNDLLIDGYEDLAVEVPLDSFYIPLYDTNVLVNYGYQEKGPVAEEFRFDEIPFLGDSVPRANRIGGTMSDKARFALYDFIEANTHGFFKHGKGAWYTGSEGFEFLSLADLINSLMLSAVENAKRGINQGESARLYPVFINEQLADFTVLSQLDRKDVLYFKVFDMPFYGPNTGWTVGALALYTRPRREGLKSIKRTGVYLSGYTPGWYIL
jgi:hypothetical protein